MPDPIPDSATDPAAHLPLTPMLFNVLLALGRETMHGYGIIQTYEQMTEGRETLLPGSLYSAMGRMVKQGMIEETAPPAGEGSGGPARRYYRVTAFGHAVAQAESRRMERLLGVARDRLPAKGGG